MRWNKMEYEEFILENEKNIQNDREEEQKRRINEIKESQYSEKTKERLIKWVNEYCDFNSLKEKRKYLSVQKIRESGKQELDSIWDSATEEDKQDNLNLLSKIKSYDSNCLRALLFQLK